jgi:hypothetical protein
MKFLKSLLMGTGGVVLAGLVLALLAPRAVHAVVATAVQVVNTSASPAMTEDVSLQASQIVTLRCNLFPGYQQTSCSQIMPNGVAVGSTGQFGGYVVPANQYFVLKSMDTSLSGAAPLIALFLYKNLVAASTEDVNPPAYGQVSFSSGIAVGPGMELAPINVSGSAGAITLHGYLTSN